MKGNALRVIGGSLRGRKLATIRGLAIRPTADRVREALFNILGSRPVDAHVLDLFAGTGALGIEALSRGAKRAVFVDKAAQALQIIRKNIALCRLEARTDVLRLDIAINPRSLLPYRGTFDLIFIDPPYNRGMIRPTLLNLSENHLPSHDAIGVIEHAPSEIIDPPPSGWILIDQRRYGQTQLSFLSFAASPVDPSAGS
ncbi:MAG: 16S rRNA (guanine(966)-N(2))-methyltransferase RsmD [Desulfobacteraceae bacterium]|nr:MAG: 16S rRNA (guanine(966)-N(2))-methyltransferase RsmD [Desulfobacteraceae bacterium]